MTSAPPIIMDQTHRRADVLVEPEWLEEHLDDPQLRLIEVDVGATAYDQGHIPGAAPWNVYRDLKDSDYRLLAPVAMEDLLARTGIEPGSTVVCYGYAPALAFWLMKLYRHADVRVLDCSRGAWMDDGRPWTADPPTPTGPTTRYPLAAPDPRIRADYATVKTAIGRRSTAIADVRSVADSRATGSGRPGHPSHRVAPGTFPPPYTCRSTTSATTEAGSVPSTNSAGSLHRSPQRPSATSSRTAPSAAEPPPPGSC
jgi:3-mercaptopyruvate sulfurtransferase SseA